MSAANIPEPCSTPIPIPMETVNTSANVYSHIEYTELNNSCSPQHDSALKNSDVLPKGVDVEWKYTALQFLASDDHQSAVFPLHDVRPKERYSADTVSHLTQQDSENIVANKMYSTLSAKRVDPCSQFVQKYARLNSPRITPATLPKIDSCHETTQFTNEYTDVKHKSVVKRQVKALVEQFESCHASQLQ